MKKLLQALLLTGFLALPQPLRADAVVSPVVSGVSAVGSGTWMVAKGVTGILWAVTKGVYHGGAAVGRGIGHMVHHTPKEPAPGTPAS